ncbi:MAG: hypothetical protein V2A74_00835 [bacterium]
MHDRYKDLAQVEWAFRTSKTVLLEMRPVYVQCTASTRGHAFVVMLAYLIAQELATRWQRLDVTVEEGVNLLRTVCSIELRVDNACAHQIPEHRENIKALLNAANVRLPEALPCKETRVDTRKNSSARP